MTRRTVVLLLAALLGGERGIAHSQGVPGVTYAEQPTGIALRDYATTWPALEAYVRRLEASDRAAVKTELRARPAGLAASDGALNLLAQLEREDGAFDAADVLIGEAATRQPGQFLHPFQQAMIAFARLGAADGALARWKWQRRTRKGSMMGAG